MVKALGMISGGLDSTLAAKIMLNMGIEVEGVHFYTGFCITEHTRSFKDPEEAEKMRPHDALRVAGDMGIRLHMVDISKDYLPVVTHPKYGYGANMNPCLDCRSFMLGRAKQWMEKVKAQFVFTGEVLGQRPMSQYRKAMKIIEQESGLEGLLLRPLSAQLLEPTTPEKQGWVDREKLLSLSGRSRKPQIKLAEEEKLPFYAQPAGGCCYLTDPNYASRLKDLFDNRGRESLTHDDVILLKVGRHFRISSHLKVVVGRNERENNFLMANRKSLILFRVPDYPSAIVLAENSQSWLEEELHLVASIAARYSDGKDLSPVRVMCEGKDFQSELNVDAIGRDLLEKLRIFN